LGLTDGFDLVVDLLFELLDECHFVFKSSHALADLGHVLLHFCFGSSLLTCCLLICPLEVNFNFSETSFCFLSGRASAVCLRRGKIMLLEQLFLSAVLSKSLNIRNLNLNFVLKCSRLVSQVIL
jgi:hypothetical protein